MSADPIYVVVCADDLQPKRRPPCYVPNPIVMETDTNRATLESAKAAAARLEPDYGPCRIARLVFLDEEAAEASEVLHVGGQPAASTTTHGEEPTQ